jgi:hypothetical protein
MNKFDIDKQWKIQRTNPKLLIAFSLYGDNPKYTEGAVQNVLLANIVYPNWTCRFYVDNSVPKKIIDELLELGAQIYFVKSNKNIKNRQRSLWRFLPLGEVCRVIFRDTDSRVNTREQTIIQNWLKSGKTFSRIWDAEHQEDGHSNPLMAGMWGAVSNVQVDKKTPDNLKDYDHNLWKQGVKPLFPKIEEQILNWKIEGYRSDEMFLIKYIIPKFKGRLNCHIAGCGIDPTPFQYLALEETNGIKYKIKDVKLKSDEDRTSFVDISYDTNKMPKLTKSSFKEIMIQNNNKGGRIGDPIEPEFDSFKRENLFEFFVKFTKSKSKNCRWFFAYN